MITIIYRNFNYKSCKGLIFSLHFEKFRNSSKNSFTTLVVVNIESQNKNVIIIIFLFSSLKIIRLKIKNGIKKALYI